MGTIRLFIVDTKVGTQFILKDYPELQVFDSYSKRKDIKRLNIEQYFKGVDRNYLDYIKVVYGPVFGMDDRRNGFIYEHKESGELIVVDEDDVPITYETCDIIMGDLDGMIKTDTDNIKKGVVTSYNDMIAIANKITNNTTYTELIRDQWIPNKSFLIID